MIAISQQTHEEKLKMYSKLTKRELAELLIQANTLIEKLNSPTFVIGQPQYPPAHSPWWMGPTGPNTASVTRVVKSDSAVPESGGYLRDDK